MLRSTITATLLVTTLSGCASAYYNAWEKVGVHKRDILVDRVEDTRDAQADAQEEFKDALEQFGSVVTIQDTDLKRAYDKFSAEYEDSEEAAQNVTKRIEKVESVAEALFEEWEAELAQYQNASLRSQSKQQLNDTRRRYQSMLRSMRSAEKSMYPVLKTFKDYVLILKHNLNAQAVGSLKGEFASLKNDIQRLIGDMNKSIAESEEFINSINTK